MLVGSSTYAAMPCAVSNRCSQKPSRPASKQHATSAGLPSLAEARERSSAMTASSVAVSSPATRCNRSFSVFGSRAAMSHDETLSSIETYTRFSDGMAARLPGLIADPASLPSSLGGVLPHSI